jgi:hypothetical protein
LTSTAELRRWTDYRDRIATGLSKTRGLRCTPLFPSATGQAYPVLQLDVERDNTGRCLRGLIEHLRRVRPKVILAEDERDRGRAYIYPICLREQDVDHLVRSVRSYFTDTSTAGFQSVISKSTG